MPSILHCTNLCYHFAGKAENPLLSTLPLRVIIYGHDPNENMTEGDAAGKLVHLPDSIEDLFKLAGEPYMRWSLRDIYC